MKKKISKIFISTFIVFCVSFVVKSMYAREILDLDELGQQIEKINKDAENAYIVGEYIFTSGIDFKLRDVMLGATSISVSSENETKPENMNIYSLSKNFQTNKWELKNNFIGSNTLSFDKDNPITIKYVDYNKLKEAYTVTLDLNDDDDSADEYKKSIRVDEGKIDKTLITGDNAPTRKGYKFKEWVWSKSGEEEKTWDFEVDEVKEPITLKATWYDEVNTDDLIDTAKKKINDSTGKYGYYYDVSFEKGNPTLTFNVYDLNKKNSEISNTGLIADIVDIVKEDNVLSITISNGKEDVVFDADDVIGGAGPTSSAWKQFAYLLCKLTNTSCNDADDALSKFINITLGDLAKIQDELTLKVTLNEEKARSQNNNVVEEYKIKFAYDAKATIGTEILQDDVQELKDKLNYTIENTYNIGKTADGLYEILDDGYVTEKEGVKGFGDSTSGFYFAYTITLDDSEKNAEKINIKLPKKPDPKTDDDYNIYTKKDLNNGQITILMEVEENEVTKYRDIIIEVNGVPTRIRIDFSKLELRKNSKFEVTKADDETKLKESYGWTKPTDYNVEYTLDGDKVKVTGLLPIFDSTAENLPFKEGHDTGYYIAFAIKTRDNKDDNKTTVNIIDGEETFKWTGKDFDENQTIYMLKHLHPNSNNKTFTIEVDMDGEGTKYNSYTITVDWSELKLQVDSEAKVELDKATEQDKNTMKEWGYTTPNGQNVTLADGMLKGTLVEQQLTAVPFGEKDKDGYYFDFTIQHPEGVNLDKEKIEITRVKSHKDIGEDLKQENIIKKFTSKDLDKNNDLTILYRFPKDTTSCTKCTGKETCEGGCCGENGVCDRVLYYVVDWDGANGKEFLPVVYSIDYCGVTFEKSSIVEISDLGTVANAENENWKGWTEDKNYLTEFKTEGNTVKVSGLIPIFDDDEWNESNPFGNLADDYYLAFKLKKAGTSGTNENTTVRFLTDGEGSEETNTITEADFGGNDEIYVLKYINPRKYQTTKKFKINVDFDDDKGEYKPYEVTIDWSDLHFQYESYMTEIDALASEDDIADITIADKNQITEQWGYDFKNAGKDITVEEGKGLTVAYELGGKIKEQTLKKAAGFDTDKGYYIVLKINGPTTEDLEATPYVTTDKWTVQLKDSKGNYKPAVAPSAEDYKNGFVTALIKLDDKPGDDKKITYMIDWDGDGNDFLPYEETIDYSKLEFLSSHKITIDDGTDAEDNIITVWDEDVITTDNLPAEPKLEGVEKDYRSFAYWDEGNGTKFETKNISKDTEDIKIVPHWNIYSDKFISDVLEDLNNKDDFSEEFVIEDYKENSGKVTITVKDPTVKLSRMNETSIPGTIAYILLKDEIKEITLSINGQEKTFTKGEKTSQEELKQQVINDAKELYSEILKTQFEGKDEDTVTLSDLAHKEGYNSFKLKIKPESLPETITLTKAPEESGLSLASVVDVPTEYEFKFESDAIIVNSENDLNEALKSGAENIFIGKDFTVSNPVDITRKVVINGGKEHHKLTASGSAETIFKVSSPDVTIDAITLADAKTPIIVESNGNLATTGLTIEGDKAETAVEVKSGATLNISKLTFNGEKYDKPAVKSEKTGANIEFTDSENKPATKLEKVEKITKYENQLVKSNLGDKREVDSTYKYYNYYNKVDNSKIYKIVFHNHEGRRIAEFNRYCYHNEQIEEPNTEDSFIAFKGFRYDGYDYTKIGYTESGSNTVFFDDADTSGVIKNLGKATSDKYYFIAYNAKLDPEVKHVKDADQLYNALQDPTIKEIYIENNINYTDKGAITINRKLSLIGPSTHIKLQVKGGIKITADDVFIHRIDFEIEANESDEALIDVTTSNSDELFKFILWQSSLKNVGNPVDSAIKLDGTDKVATDIRWNTFEGENIKNTFIDIEDPLAGVSEICTNTFRKINSSDGKKTCEITINSFDISAKITDTDEPIRIENNTYNNDYAIKILKDANKKEADISLLTSKVIAIAVECGDSSEDFSNIKFHVKDFHNIEKKYLSSTGDEIEKKPDNVEDITILVGMEVAGVDSIFPEQAVIKGLKLNGDTYSGVISQSEDGKFYLPVALTSNDFEDRVSTVKVTDPNGNVKSYLYGSNSNDGIATVSNAKTMNLQLEAIKSSKITGNNGKVYKLELDPDGANSNQYEVKEYTINYSDVETLEEKINQAAQNTLDVNSFTVKKNNKINGYTEAFTYQYNKNDGLTHLTSDNGDNVEEYAFALKYAGIEDENRTSSVVVSKAIAEEDGRENLTKDGEVYKAKDGKIYINDWVYMHPLQVGRAIHEITMLTDVMKDSKTSINAIDTVEAVEGKEHTYKVKLNGDKYTDWVKNNYRLTSKYTTTEWGETVLVDVELDENDQYIKSIKTHQESSSNTFDVTFENVDDTTIEKPIEFLSKGGKQLTADDITKFYEAGKAWWDKYVHENAYDQQ